jgi:putative DNA primase/helicase
MKKSCTVNDEPAQADPGPRPVAPEVNAAAIPEELRHLPFWVCWKFILRGGRWTKPLLNARTGGNADSTKPATWSDFRTAFEFYQRRKPEIAGIGFVFADSNPYAGIDLDHCLDPATGRLSDLAAEIISRVRTYTEESPSRTGLKLFLRGKLPATDASGRPLRCKEPKLGVELYCRARYFTLTGLHWPGTPATIEDRQGELEWVYDRLFRAKNGKPASNGSGPVYLDDAALIEKAKKAKNGAAFSRLWSGDTAGYDSPSEADLALAGMLAFWTGPDAERIKRIARQSGLSRDKWGREDYLERTIEKALAGRTEYYQAGQGRVGNGATGGANGAPKPEPAPGPDEIHLTELGNARRLVLARGRDFRHCFPWRRDLVWDGTRWIEDNTQQIVRWAKAVIRDIYREASETLDGDDRTNLLAHGRRSEADKAIKAFVNLARSEPTIPVLPEQMDADPYLFNVANGTLNLRTGELHKPRREDLLTKLAPVEFVPEAQCPTWIAFLNKVMDGKADLIAYMQRCVGYALTGNVDEHCLWLLHGSGCNGKSTFLGTVLALLGDYGLQAVSELLMARSHEAHPTERADLFRKRFVATIEVDQGKRLAESLMKQMTGGDRIRARRLYQDFFEFEPTHKIFLAANHKPEVAGTDLAVWRRIKLVPFVVTIAEHEKDKALAAKLRKELSGVLAWAVRGCLNWQQGGLGEPKEVRQATDEYRQEQDSVQQFIDACCFVNREARAGATPLYEAYLAWSGNKGMSQKAFGTKLGEKGFAVKAGHGNVQFRVGIGLQKQSS